MFQFGIDQLLASGADIELLKAANVGLVAHPASVTTTNQHSVEALFAAGIKIKRAFGPQHGMRGDVQDNMIETDDYVDPVHNIPVISLYGEHRYPTPGMLTGLDVILYDLQDIGCRIYTYITTLKYFVETCAEHDIALWILDRPNPAGRPVDGLFLEPGQESFVGCASLPTRHGLTTGELAGWFNTLQDKQADLRVILMGDYDPVETQGWPAQRPWVNPSPNAASVNMARCFPGTVLLEGTTLSEGRGTTVPLEVVGAPDFPVEDILELIADQAPEWLSDAWIRPCFFEPTFHKYQGQMCRGIQVHTGYPGYNHESFKPYRLIAGILKTLRVVRPDYEIWRHHEYEYELDRVPIDVINGGASLRNWVEDQAGGLADIDPTLKVHQDKWLQARQAHLIYPS